MKICFVTGGTGGHIFPAISIANAIKAKQPNAKILFVGALAKGTTKAVLGGGKGRKKRTNWDHLSYGQKAWLHDHSK